MRRLARCLTLALLFLTPALSRQKIKVDFREFTLGNGLWVIIVEDHNAPVFSICVTYNVGSGDEKPGRTEKPALGRAPG